MSLWRSLSGRLLLLTVSFVMLAEVLIFVPSVARFREEYMRERMEKAQIASFAILAAGGRELPEGLERELVQNSEVFSVALKRDGARELMLMAPGDMTVDATFDLRDAGVVELIQDALSNLVGDGNRYIRVIGTPRFGGGDIVEIVIDSEAMRRELVDYGIRIFNLSLVISAITAGLVFLSVNFFLVRPMRRVIDGIVWFRDDPEDQNRVIKPSGASSEIGIAERELAETQRDVAQALKQKSRLAALGEAVAKISHDLRNILAAMQLLTDRLESSTDPIVARVAPKLVNSLDRAIRLCRQTLQYGRADEPPPQRRLIELDRLVDEVGAALGLQGDGVGDGESFSTSVRFVNAAPAGVTVMADDDQLFRALLNLGRNAAQAIDGTGRDGEVRIEARRVDPWIEIDVVDDGPGLPETARENLFQPFKGSNRRGGTGLGLAIAAELVEGHGGRASLVDSDASGTRFRLTLPVEATDDNRKKASPPTTAEVARFRA